MNTKTLSKNDWELLERVISKHVDGIALSVSRAFDRFEERIDAGELRLGGRFVEIEARIEQARDALVDYLDHIGNDVREVAQTVSPLNSPPMREN